MSKRLQKKYSKWNVLYGVATVALIISLIVGLFFATYGNRDLGTLFLGITCALCATLFFVGSKRRGVRYRYIRD